MPPPSAPLRQGPREMIRDIIGTDLNDSALQASTRIK